MNGAQSQTQRRGYVVLNLASLIILELIYHWGVAGGVHNPVAVGLIVVCLIGLVLSFLQVIWRTGLWKLTHAKVENLDERQVIVTREALRYSYEIFVPCSLLLMYVPCWVPILDGVYSMLCCPRGSSTCPISCRRSSWPGGKRSSEAGHNFPKK